MPTMSTLFGQFDPFSPFSPFGRSARRLGAVVAGVLLSGAVLPAEPATALSHPSSSSFRILGSFHLKRVEVTSSVTEAGALVCTSASSGSGPTSIYGTGPLKDPAAACRELAAVNGDFTRLAVHPTWLPPMLATPVDVEARGTWQGARVDYSREFTNDSWLMRQTGDVFVF